MSEIHPYRSKFFRRLVIERDYFYEVKQKHTPAVGDIDCYKHGIGTGDIRYRHEG